MSATFHIYRPINANYKGYYMDTYPSKELDTPIDGLYGWEIIEKKLGAPDDPTEFASWEKKQMENAWSDGIEHIMFEISYYNELFNGKRSWRRIEKKLSKFPSKVFITGDKKKIRYISTNEVAYAQGWFLKNSFFKKECTFSVCTSKKEMLNFFKKYVDFNKDFQRAKNMVDVFIETYKDGDIFVATW